MEKDKNKIKEPYHPEHTPNPPQIIDPSIHKERGERDEPVENRKQEAGEQKNKQKKEEKPKRLGESPTEIDDETTI